MTVRTVTYLDPRGVVAELSGAQQNIVYGPLALTAHAIGDTADSAEGDTVSIPWHRVLLIVDK